MESAFLMADTSRFIGTMRPPSRGCGARSMTPAHLHDSHCTFSSVTRVTDSPFMSASAVWLIRS
jgi:hypothetical protein